MASRIQSQQKRSFKKGSSVLWLIPTQILAIGTAFGAAAGENLLRLTLLGGMLSTMIIPLMVSLEAGLTGNDDL